MSFLLESNHIDQFVASRCESIPPRLPLCLILTGDFSNRSIASFLLILLQTLSPQSHHATLSMDYMDNNLIVWLSVELSNRRIIFSYQQYGINFCALEVPA